MSDDNTYSIMLFVLGLFLIGVGIYLSTYYQINTNTFDNPFRIYLWTTQPYVVVGVTTIIVGIVLVVGALIKARKELQQ